MTAKLDPTVIDQLRKQYGFTNFEQVGNKLNRTSHTVRNWYRGQTLPSAQDLVKLQFLTGRPYGTMLVIKGEAEQAA
ncbi:transcriptional regulator [Corynebacterium pseudodiphtheriticum]|uniref:transcriptional regulator n=1 Tax=Corynebacterium pseudodiphtheriticum TaxID=37637 RepID=UPI002541E9B3|nr:transcriptional regulator [Corynebacterium pseudodiphtheriticum]MDK4286973.1 transcriptional regulator [Corynebacterium pseudodiphtheriticum]